MINKQLLAPESIVVVGGSSNVHKPGGAIVRNILAGGYQGILRIINPKEDDVQGIKAVHDISALPDTDLAILVIAAKYCPDYVERLAAEKGVKAFIIVSAGFSEETAEGARLEQQILESCERHQAALIGPNCIGLLNTCHHSIFTKPIPRLTSQGADFISASGATAVFILESAVTKGLPFHSVWSVGNSHQNGVEEVLQYMDEHFNPETDSRVKLLYIENIANPDKLLFHASSLIRKGCQIAAVKSGSSASGSRAASSHTGAIASSDSAVEALFRKAGIVRCFSREELTTAGCIFIGSQHITLSAPLHIQNCAIITEAGGPGVMLTDALSKGGLQVPKLEGPDADELKALLYPGASVANPIDILATGTPQHMGTAIDYCEQRFHDIDAIFTIIGTPGLVKRFEMYDMLHQKMQTCSKPIFPILPCIHTAGPEVSEFISKGHVNFGDEVALATTLTHILNTPRPAPSEIELYGVDIPRIRTIIQDVKTEGYLPPELVRQLLTAAGIPMVPETVTADKETLLGAADQMGYPLVAKVVGPVHKTDVGGVTLNIRTPEHLALEYDRMMQIPDAHAIMIQPMLRGRELFIGAKYEPRFGHVVLCGLGGIFVEVLKDVSSGLAPLSYDEAGSMIRALKGYKILQGTRGQQGINIARYAEIIVRLSTLLRFATEIKEMDINPLIATHDSITVVDARILVQPNRQSREA